MEVARRVPWLYNFRSSETFIVIVVCIAIFTVSTTIPEVLTIANIPDKDVFIYGMVCWSRSPGNKIASKY
jgi:hypothetical protein